MDIDRILQCLNDGDVDYLLLGGVNFLLRHQPVLTYDVDFWIEASEDNRRRCEKVLAELDAEWGETDDTWQKVIDKPVDWLTDRQQVYCLASPFGAIDIFIAVKGLNDWRSSKTSSVEIRTANGTRCRGLGDSDMLACQLALEPSEQKRSRIEYLQEQLNKP